VWLWLIKFYLSFLVKLAWLVLTAVSFNLAANNNVRLVQLSLEQGLSQTQINSIVQDDDGYLWIGTQQGLNIYDGHRLKTISGPDHLLEIQSINSLFKDSHNNIWVGSVPNRNFKINKVDSTITEYDPPYPAGREVQDSAFFEITEDHQKNLWLATMRAIFFYESQADEMSFVVDFEPTLASGEIIRDIYSLPDHLLVATSKGFFSVDKLSKTISSIPFVDLLHKKDDQNARDDRNNVKGIFLNNNNNFILATVEGLYEYTDQSLQQFLLDSNKEVQLRILDNQLNVWKLIEEDSFYWLATHQGLVKLSKNGELEYILAYSKTPVAAVDDNIIAMIKDYEGNLWLGSRNDGAFKWRDNQKDFSYFNKNNNSAQSLSHNMVWATAEDNEGNIWVGTRNGLNRINPKTGDVREFLINSDIKATVSQSTVVDIEIQGDELWLATVGSVRRFNTKTLKETTPEFNDEQEKILAKSVSDLFFIEDDVLAVMSRDGLHTFNTSTGEVSLKENTNPDGDIKKRLFRMTSVDPNDQDKLQMTMVDQVVSYSKSSGSTQLIHALPPSDKPRTFASDIYTNQTHTWIAYPGFGIYIVDNKTGKEIKHISSLDGLPDNSPLEFKPDKHGNIWVTSNSGLIRFDQNTFHFRVYDVNDGLATNEFNGGASIVTKAGELYLGSIKGVLQVSPEKLLSRSKTRQLKNHITDISLMSQHAAESFSPYVDHHLNLTHQDYGLKLAFSALSFTNPKKLRYKYWIEGSSETPPSVTDQSELFLPKLEPGNSIFKVAVIDYETGKESDPVALYLNVKPHPAFSWWAYSLYILTIALIFFAFYRQRVNRQRALLAAHDVLVASEERLQLALTGSNSGMWDWQAENDQVFEPRLHKSNDDNNVIDFSQRLFAIHEEERALYRLQWQKFIEAENAVFEFSYRMKNQQDEWLWYRDLARVTERSKDNKPKRVTGTYSDITQTKDDHDKIALFSEAFQNTRDSVIICDGQFVVQAANQSMYRSTLFNQDEIINHTISYILMPDQETLLYESISGQLADKGYFEGEAFLLRKHQLPLPVLVAVNRFSNNSEQMRYVIALTDISEQKAAQQELRKLANYDSLTGLPNRALLMDRIAHALTIAKRKKLKLAVFFIDLDRFKQINDTLGHDVGDQLLVSAAKVINYNIRANDTVARLGGDEFVVMLEDVEHVEAISRVAINILTAISQPLKLESHEISVSSSIGIATYPNDGLEAEDLLKHADIAMYHAKNSGRNNFQLYHAKMNELAHKRLTLENEIRSGIRNKEFILHYQPKLSLTDNSICGFELLARWQKQDGSLVPPFEFIPLSEELGLIIEITEQLIEQALQTMQTWIGHGINTSFALNLSAKHLHHHELLDFVEEKLCLYQVPASSIEFELTESTIMEDIDSAVSLLNKLNLKGIAISLDDFGTGYTSFKYLKDFPIDALKIDRTFVQDIGIDKKDEAIIESIITLAKKLEIKTIAEGVETIEQAEYLKRKGAGIVQGYLYSKPVPVEQALKLVQQKIITI
jgi:diguanylate cyclase (GGDEF)-like protein/PAS domain S-box-containing protein